MVFCLNVIDKCRADNHHLDIPLFRTEQGRYLATTLGDPLIKGLTEIAEKRPKDPVAYLAAFLHNFAKEQAREQRKQDVASGVQREPQSLLPAAAAYNFNSENQNDEIPSSPEETSGDDRDEHGQSMLHFACARTHGRNALLNLIEESDLNIAYRDELYRTARDVSLQANQPANAREIDRYVLSLAARGELSIFQTLVLDGYDHILDVHDEHNNTIIEIAHGRNHLELARFLESLRQFEENREDLHQAIRANEMDKIRELTALPESSRLVKAKNYYGRSALHIAVLRENEELVDYLATTFKGSLKIGDNLERTALHYAMGINTVETISRILIKNGAKRIVKDLKGRQPTYYFMNKADILRLQEEEDEE